jgi:CRISPR-associated endonuclease Csy4
MDQYIDLRIRPDPEFSSAQLMSALFQKLHLTLADLHSNDVGISFPEYQEKPPTLGGCLRLHGKADRLQTVVAHPHMAGMRDYIDIGHPATVPAHAQFRVVNRKQAKGSPERLLRRQMRRHGYASLEEARQAAIQSAMTQHGEKEQEAAARIDRIQTLSLPYVSLRSHSTGQPFRLFIQQGAPQTHPVEGEFNTYGLSANATVPCF